jgi:hypothetical protein
MPSEDHKPSEGQQLKPDANPESVRDAAQKPVTDGPAGKAGGYAFARPEPRLSEIS